MIYRKPGAESVARLLQQPGFVSSFELPVADGCFEGPGDADRRVATVYVEKSK
jgi:hypothetical protein